MTNYQMGDVPLKLPESDVSPDHLWQDDALDRSEVAGSLTNLVKDQESPFVIGLHGGWGTGKTFLLRRWQVELDKAEFKSIYFNAWEDDFCDDPLAAIIGQLSEKCITNTVLGICTRESSWITSTTKSSLFVQMMKLKEDQVAIQQSEF